MLDMHVPKVAHASARSHSGRVFISVSREGKDIVPHVRIAGNYKSLVVAAARTPPWPRTLGNRHTAIDDERKYATAAFPATEKRGKWSVLSTLEVSYFFSKYTVTQLRSLFRRNSWFFSKIYSSSAREYGD